jgi:tetraacyldisaccharide 4'-kinase
VFRAAAFARRLAYRLGLLERARLDVPVVVVGNLVAGGSGKTPLALWLAEFLKARGRTPGLVSRGYGGSTREPREASIASEPSEVGDEPVVLARRSGCPVWVGARRAAAARALRAAHPEVDVLVLDDGLQHYAIARDLEIAVVDARGFGNGLMLPAGPLREPASRLRSVDAVVAHGIDPEALRRLAGRRPVFSMKLEGDRLHCLADARDRRPASAFAGKRVHAVAAIGDPKRFFLHLARLGLEVVPHPFPDHHAFRAEELEFGDELPVVMTEKDAVKCRRFATPRYWVLPVRAVLDPAFGDWLSKRLGGPKAA